MASKPASFVIDDSTRPTDATPGGRSRGLRLAGRPKGLAYAGVADPFPDSLLIDKAEWADRINEREKSRRAIKARLLAGGVRVKDQESTNYCWINAPTFLTEVTRFLQNERRVVLSPASAGARIKKYKNAGGWGKEGLEWIAEHGLVPADQWPANAIDRRYETPANVELARRYRVVEWWELEPRNLEQQVSCLLRGFPIAAGFNWWAHEVSLVDAVWVNRQIGIQFANSWGESYGDKGYGVLQGSRMLSDDSVVPRSAIAA